MKRKRILTQFLLYFLMFMFLIVAGCSDSDDDDDAATNDTTVERWVTVSGTVTTAAGTPLQGVMMSTMYQLEVLNINLWEGSIDSDLFGWIYTDENGNYDITLPAALVENYTLILTPSKKDYTFAPDQRIITVSTSDITGQNFTATTSNKFSQADLVGTWRINMLRAGTENLWMRARVTIAANGAATCNSMYLSSDPTDNLCLDPDPADPTSTVAAPFELIFTMASDGVITQTGANAVENGGHMTMNSNKNFAAGTGTNGTSYQLMIAQKEDVAVPATPPATLPTTHYSTLDVQSKSFVVHSLSVGGTNEWRYGNGSTSPAGLIAMEAEADSAGGAATTLDGWTLALDRYGYVTRTDAAGLLTDFQGFLSADERTIVGTYSVGGTDYRMIIIQLNSTQPVTEMTGSSTNHILAGPDAANLAGGTSPIWAYHDIKISRFETTVLPDILQLTFALNVILSYDWQLSLPYTTVERLTLTDLEKINIDNTGEATILDPATDAIVFHGQLSYCGTFMVGVETLSLDEGDFYGLNVITKQ